MASPTGSVNPLPTQPLAYYDDQGNNGTITFTQSTVTISAQGLAGSPLTYSVSVHGDEYTGANATSSLELKVESVSLCYGVITITSPAATVNFGAKLCDVPGGNLVLMNGSQNAGTILITTTQTTVTLTGSSANTYPVTAFNVGSSISFASGATVSGSLSTPTTGQVTISGSAYSIVSGPMLPSPTSGSWSFQINNSVVGSMKVDKSSQLWLTRTAGNKLYGPLFLPIDSISGTISNGQMDGRMHIGTKFYNAMTGTLNPTEGGAGSIFPAEGTPPGKEDSWTADGSGDPK